jgi:sugar-specific transcriptional regulator TrmB
MTDFKLPNSLLSTQESAIYTASLELGTDTVAHIAEKANLPRSTTYLIIEGLIKKGLLSTTKINHKPFITAEPPNRLIELVKNYQSKLVESLAQLQSILPNLEAINNNRTDKPSISFYSGFEGIKTILLKSLKIKEILVQCSGYEKEIDSQTTEYLNNEYFPQTNRLKIKSLEILGEAPDLADYIQKFNSELHQMKKLSGTPPGAHIDKLIFGNTVAIISYETLNGTLIVHNEIASFERKLFYELWDKLQ